MPMKTPTTTITKSMKIAVQCCCFMCSMTRLRIIGWHPERGHFANSWHRNRASATGILPCASRRVSVDRGVARQANLFQQLLEARIAMQRIELPDRVQEFAQRVVR